MTDRRTGSSFGALKRVAPIAAAILLGCSGSARAAGADSRTYTCNALHALIAQYGFVFISQATFGDFVVSNGGYCVGGQTLELRSVATSDNPECLVNYCVSRDSGVGFGN